MSKPANPLAIGGFFVGALTLLIAGILIFGGRELFKPTLQFVIFFESSLNGLNVGAPVKMQGVKVGAVKEVALNLNPKTGKILKPVVIEIEPAAFVDMTDGEMLPPLLASVRKKYIEKMIQQGLKARLELQSLLTGLLYIDLNFYPNDPPNLAGIDYRDLPELPGMPTRTDVVTDAFDQVIKELRELPLREIVADLAGSLAEIRHMLTSEETKETRTALAQAVQETRNTMHMISKRVDPLLSVLESTAQEMQISVKSLREEAKPVLSATRETMAAATAALTAARESLKVLESSTGPDSTLEETLVELRNAARAVRDLSDYLERNPNALIYGKQ